MPGFNCPNCGCDISVRMNLLALAIKADYPEEDYPEDLQVEGFCEGCENAFEFSGKMFTEVIVAKIKENIIDPRVNSYVILDLDMTDEETEEFKQLLEDGSREELHGFMMRVLRPKE